MKRKSHVARLGVLALVLTLVTTSLLGGTMARYVTEVTGTATATVAAWSFTANGENEKITDAIDLASTTYGAATIADGKIAPGTTGSFKIALDGSGSEVGIDYVVKIAAASGTALPTDLTFKVDNAAYTLGSDTTGTIAYSDTADAMKKELTVTWEWPFEVSGAADAIAAKNSADTKLADKDWALDITVTGKQVTPTTPTT